MSFDFSKKDREYFPRYCMNCGRTDSPLELHHIKGRKNESHSSPLNGIMLCKKCHDIAVQNDSMSYLFFKKTMRRLSLLKYSLTEKDVSFINYYCFIYGIQTKTREDSESLQRTPIRDIYLRCFGRPSVHS